MAKAVTEVSDIRGSPIRHPGKHCRCCDHPDVAGIDQAILNGGSLRNIGKQFGISYASVRRHKLNHLPSEAQQRAAAAALEAEGLSGSSLVGRVVGLLQAAEEILTRARNSGNDAMVLAAVKEATRTAVALGKLQGDISTAPNVSITYAPVMIELQTIVMQALAPFDDAKRAVVAALTRLSGGGSGSAPLTIAHDPA